MRHTERKRQTENKRDIETALISTLVSVAGEDSLVPSIYGGLHKLRQSETETDREKESDR